MIAEKLTEALSRKGWTRQMYAIGAQIQEFRKNGGSLEQLNEVARAVFELSGVDHMENAAKATLPVSNSRQPQARGRDHCVIAPSRHAADVPPARPTPNIYGAVALNVGNTLAKAMFDKVKTNDGRPWGDVSIHELSHMDRDGKLADRLKKELGTLTNKDYFKRVRDLMNPAKFEQIYNEVNAD